MSTYVHKYKCRSCGLHFALYSWLENWGDNPTCPECGQHKGFFVHWLDESEKQIFDHVPGEAPLVGIGVTEPKGASDG